MLFDVTRVSNESLAVNVNRLARSLSHSPSVHGACWNAKQFWEQPKVGRSEQSVTQPGISTSCESTQLHYWMDEEGEVDGWMQDENRKQGACTASKICFFFPPSLCLQLYNVSMEQSRGGNKQATSSLSVSAAKQPLPRPQQAICVCVCARGEDWLCVLFVHLQLHGGMWCRNQKHVLELEKRLHKQLPLRTRDSGSCSIHRGSFVCHGHSVLDMISTQKVSSSRCLCRVTRVHLDSTM